MDRAENLRRIKAEAGIPKKKKPYKIPSKSAKKIAQEKEDLKLDKINGDTKEQWYDDRMKENQPICMNCGMEAYWLLQPEYEKIWRACQAHILPKRKTQFPSVARHPMNHLVLFPVWGGHLCGCHDEYDSGWYNATTMSVWPKAVERFRQFESTISPKERKCIPDALLQYVKNEKDIQES
jgi:hypothetical protein